MSHAIAAFGLGKLSIVQAISSRRTDRSAKLRRLTEPGAEKGSTAVKVTGFEGNEAGGSVASRQ